MVENSTWQQNLTDVYHGAFAFGDVDNDGDLDLALTGYYNTASFPTRIYINNRTSYEENSSWQHNLTDVYKSSIAFGDIDNDGDLDLVTTGCTNESGGDCTNYGAFVYLNNGTGFVENNSWQQNLTGVYESAFAFGDVDNDGDLDLGLIGWDDTNTYAKIYINNGTGFLESNTWQQNLQSVREGSIAFGDIDNDGDLDLALTGRDSSLSGNSKIYINDGSTFTEDTSWEANLEALYFSSLAFGDFDNDNDLDLILMGFVDSLNLYTNNDSSLVLNQTDIGSGGFFTALYRGSLAWGDIDNNGKLDLATIGSEEGRRVYINNGTGLEDDVVCRKNIIGLDYSSLALGDVDNDSDLDLIISGHTSLGAKYSKIYTSNQSQVRANTQPTPPNTFQNYSVTNGIFLKWNNGSDAETPKNGLYYNLRVGSTSSGNEIISGVYGGGEDNGYFGNMMQRMNFTLKTARLQKNTTYYWSVQTIDTALKASVWSDEQAFITDPDDVTAPEISFNSPDDGANITNNTIFFNITVADYNLTNVSLFHNYTSFHLNQTNSSGSNVTYVFNSTFPDGSYQWYIRACDWKHLCTDSIKRKFIADTTYPYVYLRTDNSSTWSSSSTVTFVYNVSDVRIANCSLIVNDELKTTDNSISANINQSFTYSLANGNYYWNINCTDSVNKQNSSSVYKITVSYTAPSVTGGSGSGGGSGKSISRAIREEFDLDFSKEEKGSIEGYEGSVRIFSFNNKVKHSITFLAVKEDSVAILMTSNPISIEIKVNEEKSIDMNNDEKDDLKIELMSIYNRKASLIIEKLEGAEILSKEELYGRLSKEALFDVKVSILEKFKEIMENEEVSAKIEVFNVNNIGQVDVKIDYYITDEKDNVISSGSDTLAVEAVSSFIRSLKVSKAGRYFFNADIIYKDEIKANGRDEFIVKSRYRNLFERYWKDFVIFLVMIGIIIILNRFEIREKKEREKLEKKQKKLEKKEKILEKIIKKKK